MPRLSTLTSAAPTTTVTAKIAGEDVRLDYSMAGLSPAALEGVVTAAAPDDDGDDKEARGRSVIAKGRAATDFLASVLRGWDLVDDDDQPIPVTRATIAQLSFDLQAEFIDAIMDDASVDPTPRGTGNGSARRKGKSAASRSGRR